MTYDEAINLLENNSYITLIRKDDDGFYVATYQREAPEDETRMVLNLENCAAIGDYADTVDEALALFAVGCSIDTE